MKSFRVLACLLLPAIAVAPVRAVEPGDNIKAALRQTVSLNFDNLTLEQCAERLRSIAKINVIIHESLRPLLEAREQRLQFSDDAAGGPPPADDGATRNIQLPRGFSCTLRQMPLRDALRVFLDHYGLGYVASDDALIIASASKAQQLQREQLATIRFDNVSLAKAVEDMADRFAIELTVDARAARDVKAPISMNARQISLEDAVHLLADSANLKAAPLGNGWILTTAEKAKDWQARAKSRAKGATVTLAPGGLAGPLDVSDVGIAPGGGFGALGGFGGPGLGGVGGLGGLGFGGGLGGAGLAGGFGGGFHSVELPRALLQVAGPAPRGVQPQEKPQTIPQPKAMGEKKSLAAETLKKLNEPFEFPAADAMTFREAIKIMEQRGCPPITIHQQAFKDEAPEHPDLYEMQIKLPPVKGLTRGKVLRMMLQQVSDLANYLVHPGYIEITTNSAMLPNGQFISHASFLQRPLDEALSELSDLTGISIVLDPRVGDKGKTLITARFLAETNVAQATRVMADMADLKAIMVDSIMYVTSRSNAVVFPEEAGSSGKYQKRQAAAQ
jgi:hypothetical protein